MTGYSQKCPACGTNEAAGAYCSKCLTPTPASALYKESRGRPTGVSSRPHRATGGKRGRPENSPKTGNADSEAWACDWQPDDLNPGPDCPYCAGQMCGRFDSLGPCRHDRTERHG